MRGTFTVRRSRPPMAVDLAGLRWGAASGDPGRRRWIPGAAILAAAMAVAGGILLRLV